MAISLKKFVALYRTQAEAAFDLGVPHRTLQYWLLHGTSKARQIYRRALQERGIAIKP